jgi:hypothetical protein
MLKNLPKRALFPSARKLALSLALGFILGPLAFSPGLLAQSAPQTGAQVVQVMGKAEILSAGRWRTAQAGDFIKPGDSVLVVGPGEVSLTSNRGQAKVNVKNDTLVSYDGEVNPNSRPWQDGKPVPAVEASTSIPLHRASQFTVSKGQAEMIVVPGQPLRVVTPLIAAAVRGTHFIVSVALDGSSSLTTLEGQVLALGRNGVSQMVGAGGGMQLTSSQYAAFLEQTGISVPSGNWQGLDPATLDKLDPQTFSDALSSPGGQSGASASTTSSTGTSTATSATSSTSGAATGTSAVGSASANTVASAIAQAAPLVGSTAAMGVAGVTTGTLAGQESQAQLVNGATELPGNLTLIDPDTNQPKDSFTTDAKGEFTMGVVAQPGQTEVILKIGGQDYLLDLGPLEIVAGGGGGGGGGGSATVTFDYANFNSAAAKYQSTATITPYFGGLTPTNPVTWTVVGIQNPTAGWWRRGASDLHGLTWGPAADSASYTTAPYWLNAVAGTAPTGAVAQLTDVVGSRKVTLKAETIIGGVPYSETIDVNFGPGPLSLFSGTLSSTGVMFAISYGNAATAGSYSGDFTALNGASATDFPAAVGVCGGTVPVGSVSSTTTSTPHSATFGAGWLWIPGSGSYAQNSRLPTKSQLVAVTVYSAFMNPEPSKFAAQAAGWSPTAQYWTGSLIFIAPGFFEGATVRFSDGQTFGRYLNQSFLVACVN